MAVFTIKGLVTFDGMEGDGFECSLYMDGKKVGKVFNEGCGGEPRFHVTDEAETAFNTKALTIFKKPDWMDGPDQDRQHGWYARDAFIGRLVDNAMELKDLKRWCKTKVLFNLHGDEEGSWRTIKGSWKHDADAITKYINGKYGDKVNQIANRDRI